MSIAGPPALSGERETACVLAPRKRGARTHAVGLGAIAVRAPQGAQKKLVGGLDLSVFIEGHDYSFTPRTRRGEHEVENL